MFAANLSEVVLGRAQESYQDPDWFFAKSYVAGRVSSFFAEVIGRLSGRDNAAVPFFRSDTPCGGGKTQTLVGLHHVLTPHLGKVKKP